MNPFSNESGAAAVRQTEEPDATEKSKAFSIDDRTARLAKLRDQYLRGTYQVDAAELSSAIVEKHLKDDSRPR